MVQRPHGFIGLLLISAATSSGFIMLFLTSLVMFSGISASDYESYRQIMSSCLLIFIPSILLLVKVLHFEDKYNISMEWAIYKWLKGE